MQILVSRILAAVLAIACLVAAPARAQDKFAGIPAALQPFVEQGEIAGAVALVADRDRILHVSAIGQGDIAAKRAMRADDLFWIASMTKPIAAVCVGILVDDGKLGFDDRVDQHLPEFRDLWALEEQSPARRVLVKAARPITLRDLLTHTSGMGEYGVYGPHWTLAEMIRAGAREPLKFQPGTKWGYSTAGIDTLCRVVEVAGGMPFAEFMQKRLLDPLDLKNTTWWLTRDQERARFATNYRRDNATGKLNPTTIHYMYGGAVSDPGRPPLGGAGLFSTAADVATFYQMMLRGGELRGKRILKPETVAEMTRKQTGALTARPGMPWGLGFSVVEDPNAVKANATLSPGSFGHGGAHGTQSWADPTRGLVYVFMIQRAGTPGGDDSPMRRAFQSAAETALAR